MWRATHEPYGRSYLWNDRDLRGLHFEGPELAGAPLRILRRHRIPYDAHRRIVGHNPFGDPELPFRLLVVLPISHRHVNGFAGKGQVDDELRCAIAFACCRIDRGHPEPDRLASFELIVQQTVAGVPRRIEVDDVAEHDQAIATRLAR